MFNFINAYKIIHKGCMAFHVRIFDFVAIAAAILY